MLVILNIWWLSKNRWYNLNIPGRNWVSFLNVRPGNVLPVCQSVPSSAESHPPPQEHQEENQGEEQESGGQATLLRYFLSEKCHVPHHPRLDQREQFRAVHSINIHGDKLKLYDLKISIMHLFFRVSRPRRRADCGSGTSCSCRKGRLFCNKIATFYHKITGKCQFKFRAKYWWPGCRLCWAWPGGRGRGCAASSVSRWG